jgi:ferredoxin
MRVIVDFDQCESNALCKAAAPGVFEVRDDDFLYVLQEEPPKELREKVRPGPAPKRPSPSSISLPAACPGLVICRGDEWLEHPGTLGRGFTDTEIRVLDADNRELPAGEVGAIYMRTPTGPAASYVGDDVTQTPRTDDGFVTVGDLGWVDDEGYLYMADRRTDMIVTGAVNVFPAEVEAALSEHPDIADVVVVGLRDPEWGRRVHAIVQPADAVSPPRSRRDHPLRQGTSGVLQGAQDRRVHRGHSQERRHEAEPGRVGGRTGRTGAGARSGGRTEA